VIVRTLPVGPLETNCYLVGCEQTHLGAVIDPGGDAADILAAVEQDGLTVQYVLLTHAHFDHIGAAKEIVERPAPRWRFTRTICRSCTRGAGRRCLAYGCSPALNPLCRWPTAR